MGKKTNLVGEIIQDPKVKPLSPHLQVYRPQITSVLSITHRMTGVVAAPKALVPFGMGKGSGEFVFQ